MSINEYQELVKVQNEIILTVIKNSGRTPCNDLPQSYANCLGVDVELIKRYFELSNKGSKTSL